MYIIRFWKWTSHILFQVYILSIYGVEHIQLNLAETCIRTTEDSVLKILFSSINL